MEGKKPLAFIDNPSKKALRELRENGKITPIVDIIENRFKEFIKGRELLEVYDKPSVHQELFDALKSLDKRENDYGHYVSKRKKGIKSDRSSGRPFSKENDPFYFAERLYLGMFVGGQCLDAFKSKKPLPKKSELIRKILADDELAERTGFSKIKRTKQNQKIDEAYELMYGIPYSAAKPPQ